MEYETWFDRTAKLLFDSGIPERIVENFLTNRDQMRELHDDGYAPAEVLVHFRKELRLAAEAEEQRVQETLAIEERRLKLQKSAEERQAYERALARDAALRFHKQYGQGGNSFGYALVVIGVIAVATAFILAMVFWVRW